MCRCPGRYKRDDGVDLTATLYTPPGYDCARDGPLPCLLWAYPREFKSKDAAGQLRQSPYQFSGIGCALADAHAWLRPPAALSVLVCFRVSQMSFAIGSGNAGGRLG